MFLYELLMGYTPYTERGLEINDLEIVRNVLSSTYQACHYQTYQRSSLPNYQTSPHLPEADAL